MPAETDQDGGDIAQVNVLCEILEGKGALCVLPIIKIPEVVQYLPRGITVTSERDDFWHTVTRAQKLQKTHMHGLKVLDHRFDVACCNCSPCLFVARELKPLGHGILRSAEKQKYISARQFASHRK